MRRALYIVFFLGALACGLLLYWHHSKQESRGSREAPIADTPAAVRFPPPRMALAVPSRDAGPPHLVSAIPGRNAGNDAGMLVLDEHSLMQQIRRSLASNPRLAETLAREGQQRFPDSPDAEERDMILVAALFNQRRIERARDEAYSYFERHPSSRFAKDVSALTGVHPRPAVPAR